jgi:holo-[acyl-carrier protein] synthase
MSILCGVDIIEVDRVRHSLEKLGESFRSRVFTAREVEYCENKKAAKYQSYAARFAAKEAVSKAFGTGIGEKIGWKDIEIVNDADGKPHVELSDKGKEFFNELNASGISLSLSHCKSYAAAYAVIEVIG